MKNCFTKRNEFIKVKLNARKMISETYEQKFVWEALLIEYNSLKQNV